MNKLLVHAAILICGCCPNSRASASCHLSYWKPPSIFIHSEMSTCCPSVWKAPSLPSFPWSDCLPMSQAVIFPGKPSQISSFFPAEVSWPMQLMWGARLLIHPGAPWSHPQSMLYLKGWEQNRWAWRAALEMTLTFLFCFCSFIHGV